MVETSSQSPRFSVIGAGPAGCFTVLELLKTFPSATIDLYDKRPAPFGLVAYGVAPDHCRTRRVLKVLDKAIIDPRVTFHPGVRVGDPPHRIEDMAATRDAVVVCTGMELPNRLPLQGRDAGRIPIAAGLDLARWVNGEQPRHLPWPRIRHVVVVGNGNVALDAARMLARPPAELRDTDIAPAALRDLETSAVETITVVGRRGPAEARFGPEELREVGESDAWCASTEPQDLIDLPEPEPDSNVALNLDLFRAMAGRPPEAGKRMIRFCFHAHPQAVTEQGHLIVTDTNRVPNALSCDLLIEAIGHRGEPLPGLPFDDTTGGIPHLAGRVEGHPGVYVCGWIKRGARGLIGHNRKDAIETVASIAADLATRQRSQAE